MRGKKVVAGLKGKKEECMRKEVGKGSGGKNARERARENVCVGLDAAMLWGRT